MHALALGVTQPQAVLETGSACLLPAAHAVPAEHAMLQCAAPGRTPLFLAAVSGSTGVLDLLIKAGAQASVQGTAALQGGGGWRLCTVNRLTVHDLCERPCSSLPIAFPTG